MFRNMSGFGNSLFDDFRRMQRELDQLYGTGTAPSGIRAAAGGSYPPINMGSTPEQVDVYLFAAGLDMNKVDVTIHQNLLTIDGERNIITEVEAAYYRKERFEGKFHRVVTLPEDVDPDQVDASYRNGVLRITVKRRESNQPRQIEIR
jgi:HSP20 family protein